MSLHLSPEDARSLAASRGNEMKDSLGLGAFQEALIAQRLEKGLVRYPREVTGADHDRGEVFERERPDLDEREDEDARRALQPICDLFAAAVIQALGELHDTTRGDPSKEQLSADALEMVMAGRAR